MSPVDLLERLSVLDVDTAGPGEIAANLAANLGHIRALRGFLDSREATLARRQNWLSATTGAAPAADVLGRAAKSSRRTAERAERRAATLADAPALDKLLADGKVSGEHADALASEASKLDDTVRAGLFDLDAEIAAMRTLDIHRNKTRAQLTAIALVDLVCATRSTGRVPAEVVIHVPLDVIQRCTRSVAVRRILRRHPRPGRHHPPPRL